MIFVAPDRRSSVRRCGASGMASEGKEDARGNDDRKYKD